jgi:hypothetical protein
MVFDDRVFKLQEVFMWVNLLYKKETSYITK